jgi:hypothetical protein
VENPQRPNQQICPGFGYIPREAAIVQAARIPGNCQPTRKPFAPSTLRRKFLTRAWLPFWPKIRVGTGYFLLPRCTTTPQGLMDLVSNSPLANQQKRSSIHRPRSVPQIYLALSHAGRSGPENVIVPLRLDLIPLRAEHGRHPPFSQLLDGGVVPGQFRQGQ